MSDERDVNPVDVRIGQRMRARRLEIGMSQERLAVLLGVTFQQVQKYERGVNRVAASRLFDVASALDVPVSSFFEGLRSSVHRGAGGSDEREAVDAALGTKEGGELIALFASLKNATSKRRLLELARLVVAEDNAKGDPG
jgi:transcriptional regulator with XRE-family HTH domain